LPANWSGQAEFLSIYQAIEQLSDGAGQVCKGRAPGILVILNSFLLALFDRLGVANVTSRMRLFAVYPLLVLQLFFPWRELHSPVGGDLVWSPATPDPVSAL
jgi:hypothetical protein